MVDSRSAQVTRARCRFTGCGRDLPAQPRADLHETRRRGGDDLAEGLAADVAFDGGRPEKLRVIEHVEGFHAQVECLAVEERGGFFYGEVGVVGARAMEEAAARVAKIAERREGEEGGVEAGSLARGSFEIERSWVEVQE